MSFKYPAHPTTNCIRPTIEHGEISEDELGIAGKIPYMPARNSTPFAQTERIMPSVLNSGCSQGCMLTLANLSLLEHLT